MCLFVRFAVLNGLDDKLPGDLGQVVSCPYLCCNMHWCGGTTSTSRLFDRAMKWTRSKPVQVRISIFSDEQRGEGTCCVRMVPEGHLHPPARKAGDLHHCLHVFMMVVWRSLKGKGQVESVAWITLVFRLATATTANLLGIIGRRVAAGTCGWLDRRGSSGTRV